MFYFRKYYKKNIEELEKLYCEKEEDVLTAQESLLEAEHDVELKIKAFENKEKELATAKRRIRELERRFQSTNACSKLPPEIASVVEYLEQNNNTALYSPVIHVWFLSKLWWNTIPAHSRLWHPLSSGDLFTSQPGFYLLWVIFGLLVRLLHGCIAKKVAQKVQIYPMPGSKVKKP